VRGAPWVLAAVTVIAVATSGASMAETTEECSIPTYGSFGDVTSIALKVPGVLTSGQDKTAEQTAVGTAVTSWEHTCGRYKLPSLHMANEKGREFYNDTPLPQGTEIWKLRRGTHKEIGTYGVRSTRGLCALARPEQKEVIWYTAVDENRSLIDRCQEVVVMIHEMGHMVRLEDMDDSSVYTQWCMATSLMGGSSGFRVECE